MIAFQHYFRDVIECRQKQPQDDLITDLVQAKVAQERSLDTAEHRTIIATINNRLVERGASFELS
ncbi:MAG: hypothetical protein PUP93_31935 [Rhizonema sp. NSF051]|nr:hypothetical protein [Rhizonema sp. NSF051]